MPKPEESLCFQVDKNLVTQTYNVYLMSFSPDGKQVGVVNNVSMQYENVDTWRGLHHTQTPLVEMPKKAAQELLDELWGSGLRPSNVRAPDGQIKALEDHIKDLRWIIKSHIIGDTDDGIKNDTPC